MADDPRLLQWRNLPMELRLKKQWLVAHPGKKNPLFYRDNQFYNGSVSKHLSSQWIIVGVQRSCPDTQSSYRLRHLWKRSYNVYQSPVT